MTHCRFEFYLELTFIICAGTLASHLAGLVTDTLSLRSSTWSSPSSSVLGRWNHTWQGGHWPPSLTHCRFGVLPGAHLHHLCWDAGITPGRAGHWPPSLTHCRFGVLPGAHLHHLCWDAGITPGRAGHWPPSLTHCHFGVLPGAHLHHLCWDAGITPGRVVTGRHR